MVRDAPLLTMRESLEPLGHNIIHSVTNPITLLTGARGGYCCVAFGLLA
jgi:hypothetical protein